MRTDHEAEVGGHEQLSAGSQGESGEVAVIGNIEFVRLEARCATRTLEQSRRTAGPQSSVAVGQDRIPAIFRYSGSFLQRHNAAGLHAADAASASEPEDAIRGVMQTVNPPFAASRSGRAMKGIRGSFTLPNQQPNGGCDVERVRRVGGNFATAGDVDGSSNIHSNEPSALAAPQARRCSSPQGVIGRLMQGLDSCAGQTGIEIESDEMSSVITEQ